MIIATLEAQYEYEMPIGSFDDLDKAKRAVEAFVSSTTAYRDKDINLYEVPEGAIVVDHEWGHRVGYYSYFNNNHHNGWTWRAKA